MFRMEYFFRIWAKTRLMNPFYTNNRTNVARAGSTVLRNADWKCRATTTTVSNISYFSRHLPF